MNEPFGRLGFIGLGVMGEPICRNLAAKSGAAVMAFDLDREPLRRIAAHGVTVGASVREVVESVELVFLSLPSGEVVQQLVHQKEGLLEVVRPGQIIIDLSTSPVTLTRTLAAEFAAKQVRFIDAPVARTRAAAEAGTLSVMVGADAETYTRVRPLIATFATEIALCGGVGCGQVVKILNNMLLFQIGVALAEVKVLGERAGVAPGLLFEVLSKGSADSFALRNHGMKAILPGDFPPRSFSVEYARKDLRYALGLARDNGVAARWSHDVDALFAKAIDAGFGALYWPVVSRLLEGERIVEPQGENSHG